MMLQQMLSKSPETLEYHVDNLTPNNLYWCIYRKKVTLIGSTPPLERLTEPRLVEPGSTDACAKPEIKLPWKRYMVFATEEQQLTENITDRQMEAMVHIWIDELNTVILTEHLRKDGLREVRASSWATWIARRKLAPAAQKYSQTKEAFLSEWYAKLVKDLPPHMYHEQVSRVRLGSELCSDEQQFLNMRNKVVREAIQKLTGVDCSPLPPDQTPRIQICASGGGYRAMVATLGSLLGMESTGLLDCVSTMAGLSGSTWAFAAWHQSGKSLSEVRQSFCEKLPLDFYTKKLWPETIKNHIRERMGFEQDLGLVDVMGWHLHNHLLKDLPSRPELWSHPRLSEQAASIASGSKPMPIYTAVAHEHKRYRWFDFTPWEVGCNQDINVWTPTFGFGRKYNDGVSIDHAVEPSLALLQATWGSAFCATVDQMFHELDKGDGAEPATMQRLLHTLIYDRLDMAEDRLVTPAKYPNPAYGLKALGEHHPFAHIKKLKLMDAGCHTNLPFPPLLRRERGSDVIIALDQSSAPDIYSTRSVAIAQQWAKEEGLPFPECTEALKVDESQANHTVASKQRCTIIPGDVTRGIPTIIYIPLLRNVAFSPSFCPRLNGLTKGGYCSTFNFCYSADQVMELSGLTEANMKDALPQIADCIKKVTLEKIAFHQEK